MKATNKEWLALGVKMPRIAVEVADGNEIPIEAILLSDRKPTPAVVARTAELFPKSLTDGP